MGELPEGGEEAWRGTLLVGVRMYVRMYTCV